MTQPLTTEQIQRWTDLLVDGEISEDDRHRLLAWFDEEPTRWRQCGLAFLEEQTWRQEFGPLARGEATTAVVDTPTRRRRRGLHWVSPLATAATVILAFGLGWSLPSTHWDFWTSVRRPGASVSQRSPAAVGSDKTPGLAASPRAAAESVASPSPAADPRWHMYSVSLPGGELGGGQDIEIPAVEVDEFRPEILQSRPWPLSDVALSLLEQTGYRVRQRRSVLPFALPDGRHLIVPVDQVELERIAENPAFQ